MMFPVHMVLRLRELRRTWSTAFFCCRDPPQSRYQMGARGSQGLRRRIGNNYQQSDGGKMLTSIKFQFENEGEEDEEEEEEETQQTGQDVTRTRRKRKNCCCNVSTLAQVVLDVVTFSWLVRQPLDTISGESFNNDCCVFCL